MIDEVPLETVIKQTCIVPRVGQSGDSGSTCPGADNCLVGGAEPVAEGIDNHP